MTAQQLGVVLVALAVSGFYVAGWREVRRWFR